MRARRHRKARQRRWPPSVIRNDRFPWRRFGSPRRRHRNCQWYAEFLSASGHDEALAEIRPHGTRPALIDCPHGPGQHPLLRAAVRRGPHGSGARDRHGPQLPEAYEFLRRSYSQMGRYAESVDARQTPRWVLGADATLTSARRTAAPRASRGYWRSRIEQELKGHRGAAHVRHGRDPRAGRTDRSRAGLHPHPTPRYPYG